MANDFEGYLTDNGWKLAQDWQIDDLVANPGEHDRQDRFTRDVHSFLRAGQDVSENAHETDTSGGPFSRMNGAPQAEPAPFHMGMANKVQAFLKAGQDFQGGPDDGVQRLSSPSSVEAGANAQAGENVTGQGAETRGSVDTYDVRGPVDVADAPTRPQQGSATERDRWDLWKGYDHESQNSQRQQQERENWEKMKGIDPETQQIIHGPNDPLKKLEVTSNYGHRQKPLGDHHGIDFRNPLGADVYASESGVVINTKPGKNFGENQIVVQNRDGSTSFYSHTTPKVKTGQKVYSGDTVGVTDMSGRTTGPHLHYGIMDAEGNWINPSTKLPKR